MPKSRNKDGSQPSHKARNFTLAAVVLGATGAWLVRATNVRARVQDIVKRGTRPGGPLAHQTSSSDSPSPRHESHSGMATNQAVPDDTTNADPTPKQG